MKNKYEIEEIILGSILIDRTCFDIVQGQIKPEMFYIDANCKIFESMLDLYRKGMCIDLITVTNRLREKKQLENIGGAYYVSKLSTGIGSPAHLDTHIKILIQEYIKRQMVILFQTGLNELENESNDIADIYGTFSSKLDNLFDVKHNDIKQIGNIINDRLSEVEKIKPGKILGVDTGHKELNKLTSGFQAGDLIILAARPSMGKTAISLLFAKSPIFLQNKRVLYFSIEMPAKRLADRIMSIETGINSNSIQNNQLNQAEWSSLYDISDRYNSANLFINEESLTVEEIRAIATIESRKKGVDLIIVDYLQLIKFSLKGNKNTNDQVTHISKSLKQIAKKLNVPLIALSQLSRAVETRSGDKRPQLSDLRDSGAIEQDADLVAFLYRPEYYFNCGENDEYKNIIEFIIAKHRNGALAITNFYKNDTWSYLSDTPHGQEMPFNFSEGIEPEF